MYKKSSILRQPVAVWAIAFACMVSFMGIGLVDPILPAISEELNATPSQTMLLFTSYLFITAVAMLFTSWVSSRVEKAHPPSGASAHRRVRRASWARWFRR